MISAKTKTEGIRKIIHSILMIGQSNMAGRGVMSEAGPLDHEHIKVLKNGRWQPACRPINFDRSFSGVSLVEKFAEAYQKEKNVTVGIIPCADGGTSLAQWRVGGLLYDHAVMMTRLAQRTSTVAAVLWHQGEADCSPDLWPTYAARLRVIFESLRRDLGLDDVPFLVGGLGDFLPQYIVPTNLKNYYHVNDQLRLLANEMPLVGYVPAEGLSAKPDNLHFDTAGLNAFGLRYYEVFKTLEKKDRLFPDKPGEDAAIRSAMELL